MSYKFLYIKLKEDILNAYLTLIYNNIFDQIDSISAESFLLLNTFHYLLFERENRKRIIRLYMYIKIPIIYINCYTIIFLKLF